MPTFVLLIHNPLVHAALVGAGGAAAADYHGFLQFKKWSDIAAYDWGTASFRWIQGAAVGLVLALGWGAVA